MTHESDPLQAQYDGIPVPCYTWLAQDGGLVLERANREAHERMGPSLRTLLGRRVEDVFPDRPDIGRDLATALAERRTVRREMEHTLATTGERRRLDVSYVFVPPDRVMVHADDVTEQRENEERLRAVIATIESGLLTVEPERAGDRRQPRRLPDPRPHPRPGGGGPGLAPDARPAPRRRPASGRATTPTAPARRRSTAATRCATSNCASPAPTATSSRSRSTSSRCAAARTGEQNGLVVSLTDVTEARWLQERVAHQALHDPLTGLPNRLLFQERLEQALARAVRQRVVVLLIGLDRFRAINDAAGHQMGDELLVEAATRLHQVLDVAQPLARFGGDEFAVLAECEDERAGAALAQRLGDVFEAPFTGALRMTASIGIAIEHSGHSAGELIQGADAAMQRVKARGGGAFEVFDRAMEGRLRDRLRIEEGLWRAIERDELRLMYQPILELDPLRVVAVEALVRWQHPEEGLLAPGRFLPVAEQDARLISAIGDWVLRRACVEAAQFPVGVRVSVNVAARELGDPEFADRIAGTLARTGTAPGRIALEITETTLMEGGDAALSGLERLAQLGLQVYLDDFGTGYSSLTRLARLPLSGIKLDRGFVARATGERDRRIIEAASEHRPRRRARRGRRGRRDRGAARAAARRRLPLRAGLPARATRAARAVGRAAGRARPG